MHHWQNWSTYPWTYSAYTAKVFFTATKQLTFQREFTCLVVQSCLPSVTLQDLVHGVFAGFLLGPTPESCHARAVNHDHVSPLGRSGENGLSYKFLLLIELAQTVLIILDENLPRKSCKPVEKYKDETWWNPLFKNQLLQLQSSINCYMGLLFVFSYMFGVHFIHCFSFWDCFKNLDLKSVLLSIWSTWYKAAQCHHPWHEGPHLSSQCWTCPLGSQVLLPSSHARLRPGIVKWNPLWQRQSCRCSSKPESDSSLLRYRAVSLLQTELLERNMSIYVHNYNKLIAHVTMCCLKQVSKGKEHIIFKRFLAISSSELL